MLPEYACGGWSPPPIFFFQHFSKFPKKKFNFSNLYERSGIGWFLTNFYLNQICNQISDFCNFYFRVMVIFVLKITPDFDEFSPITQKIKSKKSEIWFFFLFSRFRIFHINLNTFEEKNWEKKKFVQKCSII